jgi:hypothetical protein
VFPGYPQAISGLLNYQPATIPVPFQYHKPTIPLVVLIKFAMKDQFQTANNAIYLSRILQIICNPTSTSCKADLYNRPVQGRIYEHSSCALDKVGWEVTGWMITFQFPIGPD